MLHLYKYLRALSIKKFAFTHYYLRFIVSKLVYKNKIRFSIIIPVYNHSQYLKQAIDSALSQDYKGFFELVIVDDCSSDPKVKEMLSKYKDLPNARIFYNKKNLHIANTQNKAIKNARYEWIVFLDCDDYLELNALDLMAKRIAVSSINSAYFHSARNFVDTENNKIKDYYYIKENPALKTIPKKYHIYFEMNAGHLIVIHKYAVMSVGGFNTRFNGVQDYYMAIMINFFYQIIYLPKILYNYRVHSDTISSTKELEQNLKASTALRKPLLLVNISKVNWDNGVNCLNFTINALAKYYLFYQERPFLYIDIHKDDDVLFFAQRAAYLDKVFIYNKEVFNKIKKLYPFFTNSEQNYDPLKSYIYYQFIMEES